ncbi:hypothetical protein FB107DRAFT_279907 [Schizophyllum commune]
MSLTLWFLRLLIEIVQACALQDLPVIARYAILVTAATIMILLTVHVTAPPNMLDFCGEAHDQVVARLHEDLEAGTGRAVVIDATSDTRDNALARVNSRLSELDEERLGMQRTAWGLANSAPLRVALSMPLYLRAWRLLYDYHMLSEDVKVLVYMPVARMENVTDSIEETPVPTVISDSGDRAAMEYHEMDSYAERDHPERA